jgi:hypothetical protein
MKFLQGKKTYLVAIGGVLGAVGGFLTGALTLPDAIDLAVTSVIGATLRNGIAVATAPKVEG